jgi:hydrogenase large subunit
MPRLIVGPFNRVEGDLEVQLDLADDRVAGARVVSPMYRGFETLLQGRDGHDALVIVPRICGICSVSQSVAAARALADALGAVPPPNGVHAINLMLATENAADHLTHFYLFFMPDFTRPVYAAEPWYGEATTRFTPLAGSGQQQMLPARAQFMHIMGLLAGKWPHTLALQPGGVTRTIGAHDKVRLGLILSGFRDYLERTLFGAPLQRIEALSSQAQLDAFAAEMLGRQSDFALFLRIADALQLQRLGRAGDRFMSFGAYELGGRPLFARGLSQGVTPLPLELGAISEDHAHAYLAQPGAPLHPSHGETHPDADAPGAYSWCKAPRLAGAVVEVGALARQVVSRHPLVLDLVERSGGNVRNRVVARLLEVALVTLAMQRWLAAIEPAAPFYAGAGKLHDGESAGLVEAARGGLGHWLRVRSGHIDNYQIIAPTTWNFSPRDSAGRPGALEQALVGAPVRAGETAPVAVQHIVRSFDPCMVCTVH